MRLTWLWLEDFRCFIRAGWRLSPRFNLFIGENGTGKTTALEAAACALGAWLKQFPDVKHRPLSTADYRVTSVLKGTQLDEQSPRRVLVEAKGIIDGQNVDWIRVKAQWQKSRPVPTSHDQLTPLARAASEAVVEGKDVTLPLISFYGTGRLWNVPNAQKPKLKKGRGESSRLAGYQLAVDPRTSPDLLIEWLTRQEWIAFQQKEKNPTLEVVKTAIRGCLDNCLDLRYDAAHQAVMLSFKDGEYQNFARLSDGQRNIMAMVADIAIKAATLNPHLGARALEMTPGVVLIDELDLHLHPRWQRRVIGDLKRTFPMIQFIATTHSPFLIQALEPGELIKLGEGVAVDEPQEYKKQSIEDIAKNHQGLDHVARSQEYHLKMKAAEEYFRKLREPGVTEEELKALEAEYLKRLEPFGEDPAFFAALRIERESEAGVDQR